MLDVKAPSSPTVTSTFPFLMTGDCDDGSLSPNLVRRYSDAADEEETGARSTSNRIGAGPGGQGREAR